MAVFQPRCSQILHISMERARCPPISKASAIEGVAQLMMLGLGAIRAVRLGQTAPTARSDRAGHTMADAKFGNRLYRDRPNPYVTCRR